ncbi:MAG: hypothetical protein K2O65_13335 [Lachnospiraceae bacterium]|nr:hypothetical protein [Lachnospiraceae bacterium]
MIKKIFVILCMIPVFGMMLSGCGSSKDFPDPPESVLKGNSFSTAQTEDEAANEIESNVSQAAMELVACFGDGGEPFILHLYDNDTAYAIAGHVGTSDWRLPIYHYDDFDNWEVMQYYDIPSRYEIPSAPEQITEEKAGTVYYSEPNRIILFYQDAEVSAEYTPVGYFDYTDEFAQAVIDNPVLEGWGNKIVLVTAGEPQTETVQQNETQTEAQPTEDVRENAEQEVAEMKVQIGESVFTATLADNSSVDALRELMADGPLTLNMSDYANMEKTADLGVTLPQNNEQMNTQAGDIILYQGRTLTIYYDTNSWSLTPIGKIDDVDAQELREALGTGDVTVTLSLE